MSDWAAMINGVQPALAGLDMNMPGFVGYVCCLHFYFL
jgi:beta-glucosidase